MSDQCLPVSRCPDIDATAREVLGVDDIWALSTNTRWWAETPMRHMRPVVPLDIPAGRLVAETWLESHGHDLFDDDEWTHAACLYLGDLLRLCSALGVEVPAGTVPRFALAADSAWELGVPGDYRLFDNEDEEGVTNVVDGLRDGMTPRQALDAIVKAVARG